MPVCGRIGKENLRLPLVGETHIKVNLFSLDFLFRQVLFLHPLDETSKRYAKPCVSFIWDSPQVWHRTIIDVSIAINEVFYTNFMSLRA